MLSTFIRSFVIEITYSITFSKDGILCGEINDKTEINKKEIKLIFNIQKINYFFLPQILHDFFLFHFPILIYFLFVRNPYLYQH